MTGIAERLSDAEVKTRVSANLKRHLDRSGISQRELARRTGDPVTTISGAITGKSVPGAGVLTRLASVFGVSVDDLLSERRRDVQLSTATSQGRSQRTRQRA